MKYLDSYYNSLRIRKYAKKSITDHRYNLRRAKRYFDGLNLVDEKQITEAHIFAYIKHLRDIEVSNKIYCSAIMYLTKYFEYLEDNTIIFINPMRNVKQPKEIRNNTTILSAEEVQEILTRVDTSTNVGLRAKAMLELLYSSALRVGELSHIELGDLDFENRLLTVRHTKTKKDRVVPVGMTALYWIRKFIDEVRPKYLKKVSSSYVFVSFNHTGKAITSVGIFQTLSAVMKRDNIKHFKPISLRPSSATHLLKNGMNILLIKELLGHQCVSTTRTYLRIGVQDLKRIFTEKHPRYKEGMNELSEISRGV